MIVKRNVRAHQEAIVLLLLLWVILLRRQKLIRSLVRRLVQAYTLNVDGDVVRVLLVHF